MGNPNKKLDLFLLAVIFLVLVGLPFGISFYDRYSSSGKIPPDAKHFTLTGHAERGWLIGEIPAYGAVSFWKQILESMVGEGQMTLYLFSRAARPIYDGNVLQLMFDPADQVNCREAGQASSLKILRAHAARVAGRDIEIKVRLAEDRPAEPGPCAKPEDNWVDKIKQAADSMGIPLNMEE